MIESNHEPFPRGFPIQMNLTEKKLYHQIHPLKLATDFGMTPIAGYFLWFHKVIPAVIVAFLPSIILTAAMLKMRGWNPALVKLKASRFGHYIARHMTPVVEGVRFSTLIPMAYGSWTHQPGYIELGCVILFVAWSNGVITSQKGRRAAPFIALPILFAIMYSMGIRDALDMRLYYTPAEAAQYLSSLSPARASLYFCHELFDLLFLSTYTALLYFALEFVWGSSSPFKFLGLLPGFFDLFETVGILIALQVGPSPFIVSWLGIATFLKWITSAGVILLLVGRATKR